METMSYNNFLKFVLLVLYLTYNLELFLLQLNLAFMNSTVSPKVALRPPFIPSFIFGDTVRDALQV